MLGYAGMLGCWDAGLVAGADDKSGFLVIFSGDHPAEIGSDDTEGGGKGERVGGANCLSLLLDVA